MEGVQEGVWRIREEKNQIVREEMRETEEGKRNQEMSEVVRDIVGRKLKGIREAIVGQNIGVEGEN